MPLGVTTQSCFLGAVGGAAPGDFPLVSEGGGGGAWMEAGWGLVGCLAQFTPACSGASQKQSQCGKG